MGLEEVTIRARVVLTAAPVPGELAECPRSDQAAVSALLAAYPGEAGLRVLPDGYVHVLHSVALQRITDAGGNYSEAAIAAELRSILTGVFAERS